LLAERSISARVYPEDNLFRVGLNSLDMLNLVLSLEAEFDITIPETDITIANLRTISTLSNLISRLMNKVDAVFAK
jgi:acyl carrier protein